MKCFSSFQEAQKAEGLFTKYAAYERPSYATRASVQNHLQKGVLQQNQQRQQEKALSPPTQKVLRSSSSEIIKD